MGLTMPSSEKSQFSSYGLLQKKWKKNWWCAVYVEVLVTVYLDRLKVVWKRSKAINFTFDDDFIVKSLYHRIQKTCPKCNGGKEKLR